MDCTDLISAEQILQICRNRCKTATIHGNDDAEPNNKQSFVTARANRRNGKIQQRSEHKENSISIFTPDFVGHARPQKATAHIKQAQQTHKTCRRTRANGSLFTDRSFRKQLLNHDRSLTQNADTRRHIQAQHPKQEPKLRRLHGFRNIDVITADQFVFDFRRNITLRFPTIGRYPDGKCTKHHQHQIKNAQNNKRLRYANRSFTGEKTHQRHG